MTITARIDNDFKSLGSYFRRLFDLRNELVQKEKEFPFVAYDVESKVSQDQHYYVSHLIKPDMIFGIYSCFEFWIQEICRLNKLVNNLKLDYQDIRGKHDLNTYHKYLTLVANLKLDAVQTSYQYLDNLRKVRNVFVHKGGHVPSGKEVEFSQIAGVSVAGSLITLTDDFVWNMLKHAQTYVTFAADPLTLIM